MKVPLLFENHPADSRITGPMENCQTLSSRMGTGGQCSDNARCSDLTHRGGVLHDR